MAPPVAQQRGLPKMCPARCRTASQSCGTQLLGGAALVTEAKVLPGAVTHWLPKVEIQLFNFTTLTILRCY